MHTPSFKEDHISQTPAIQLLQNMGYQYLSPSEALKMRGGKTTSVLLRDILQQQLRQLNVIHYKGDDHPFSDSNIEHTMHVIQNTPLKEGLITANEYRSAYS